MDKKGQVSIGLVLGLGLFVTLLLAGMGIIGYAKIISENTYVGDSKTYLYYDLTKCNLK